MTIEQLINEAQQIAVVKSSGNGCIIGEVGSVLKTKTGKIFKGVSIDGSCGIGFCGEHSAISAMLTANESEIEMMVAIDSEGKIYPPCGCCRELIYQVNKLNLETIIILSYFDTIKLADLLPLRWQDL